MSRDSHFRLSAGLFLTVIMSLAFCVSGSEDDSDFQTGRWRDMLKAQGSKFADVKNTVEFMAAHVESNRKELQRAAAESETRIAELRLLLLSDFYSPFQYRLISKEIYRVYSQVSEKVSEASGDIQQVNQYLEILDEMQKEVGILRGQSDEADAASTFKMYETWIHTLKTDLSKVKLSLSETVLMLDSAKNKIQTQIDEMDKDALGRIRFFFFGIPTPWFNIDTWLFIPFDFRAWIHQVPSNIKEEMPNTIEEWRTLTVVSLLLFLGMLVSSYVAARTSVARRFASEQPARTRMLLWRGWICLACAVSLFVGNTCIDFPETLVGFRVAVILVAAWGMDTAWALKQMESGSLPMSSPLRPLFWLYVVGNALQAMNVEMSVLGVIWALGLVAVIVAMTRRKTKAYPQLENILRVMTIVICCVAILACAVGFSFLAMFSIMTWFMAAIGIQFGFSISAFFIGWIDSYSAGRREVLKAVAIGFGVPTLWLVILVAVAFWTSDRLLGFKALFSFLDARLNIFGVEFSIMSAVFAIFLFFVFKTLNNVFSTALERIYGDKMEQGVVPSLQTLLYYGLGTIYVIIVLNIFGVSLMSFAIVAGGLSVGVGFGLQNIINNFVSGLIILFGRILHQGDVIEIDGKLLRILKINIRETVAVTKQNAVITIPNTEILNTKVTNWSKNGRHARQEIAVGVAYGTDLEKACRVLLECAAANPHVMKNHKSSVLLTSFADSSIMLLLRVWIPDVYDSTDIMAELRMEVARRFRAEDVVIPFNQLEVRIMDTTE